MSFPAEYLSQVSYMADLVTRVNELNKISNVLVVQKTTEPTQLDFVSRWLAAGFDLPIQPGYEFHWYDGTSLRGVYGAVDDGIWTLRPGSSRIGSAGRMGVGGGLFNAAGAQVDWSPVEGDERIVYSHWALFTVGSILGGNGIWISDLRGNKTLVFAETADEQNARYPTFNSDATKIAFVSNGKIQKCNTDGTGLTDVYVLGALNVRFMSWRGSVIVFSAYDAGNNNHIYRVNDDGTGFAQLTTLHQNHQPHLSMDGTKIAWISNESGSYTIHTMTAAGGSKVDTGVLGLCPRWSKDGTKIWYSALFNHPSYGWQASSYVIHRMNPDGTSQERKTGYVEYLPYPTYPPNRAPWIDPTSKGAMFAEQNIISFALAPDEKRAVVHCNRSDTNVYSSYLVVGIDPDLEITTGTVHLLSTYNQDWSDFQLLAEQGGGGNDFNLANIRSEFAHLLIVVYTNFDGAGASENLQLVLNADTSGVYNTIVQQANAAAISRFESLNSGGFLIPFGTDATDADVMGSAFILLPNIQSADAYKTMICFAGRLISYSTTLHHRYQYLAAGYYESLSPINQLRINGATNLPFVTGSKISVYGLGGKRRFEAS